MEDAAHKPVIFLAFANDRDDTVGYLRNLPVEARRLREVLESAEQVGLCEVVVRSNSTAGDIFKVFQNLRYRNRIAVFHYGGHANGFQLLLESAAGQSAAADAGGLAAFLAQQQGLRLVFLNGCSTQRHTEGLLDANISAVISTSRAIDDQVATDFSCQFYQGLAGGASIRTAYHEAAASVQTARGGKTRGLYFGAKDDAKSQPEADRWPWNLYLREGSESVDQWNLPEAINDPLFGLSSLPEQDLPESPYRHLNWFTRKDAEVFFGRSHQIRKLYDRLTAFRTAPIILFYGQSGVGKSSVLDAGLTPRLEQDYEIRYLRRGEGGLLDTLQRAFLPEAADAPIETAWRVKEEQLHKPMIVFLDQVEEVYTRPISNLSDELDQLLRVLKATFDDPSRRPQGKLVLGFRKEWLAELEAQLIAFELPRTKMFVEPLDRRGIIEVVRGPARATRLRERYGLMVEDGLAEIIADDLLEDRCSAIAPTLQILLTKMWTKATDANYEHPQFSRDLYLDLKEKGLLLGDFLEQQLHELEIRMPESARSGLVLDILAQHTTRLGTANQLSSQQLLEKYSHVNKVLPILLLHCQDLHLLTTPTNSKASTQFTRLAHDTLAPLIRAEFDKSDKPGQRARRILDNRSVDWADGKNGMPLFEADLKVVEAGGTGTRDLNASERRLVQVSKVHRKRAQRIQQFLIGGGVAATIAISVLTVIGWLSNRAAQAESRKAKHNLAVIDLSNADFAIREHRIADALHWYQRAVEHAPYDDWASQSALTLPGAWSRPLKSTLKHAFDVTAVAFSPDGQTVLTGSGESNGTGEARLWDVLTGAPRGVPLKHEGAVNAVAFSPDGQTVLTGDEGGKARLWDVQTGAPQAGPLEHNAGIRAVAFSPDGQTVLTGSEDMTARLWDARTGAQRGVPLKNEAEVNAVAFSPDGQTVLSGDEGGKARLWDARTGSPRCGPLEHEAAVFDVAFSPDGQTVLTGSSDDTARLRDAQTGAPQGEPLKHENSVFDVAFSPDGQTVLTGSSDETARLWDARTGAPRGEPLKHEAAVWAVAFSPDGQTVLTGSEDMTARLWDVHTGTAQGGPLIHQVCVIAVAFSSDGRIVLTGGFFGQTAEARLWNVRNCAQRGEPLKHERSVLAVAFSPDGQTVLTGSEDMTARLWDARTGAQRGVPLKHETEVNAVAFSPDGQSVLTGDEEGKARLWDARTGSPRGQPLKHEGGVNAVAFSPDGQTVLTGSGEITGNTGEARLWDARTRAPRGQPLKHEWAVLAVAFSPDGQTVLTGDDGGKARLWDVQTGAPQGGPLEHDARIRAVAISPDGQTVLTGSEDKTARLWDARTGAPRGEPLKHEAAVWAVAFSPDGQTVLTGAGNYLDYNGEARLWDVRTGVPRGEPMKHKAFVSAVAFSPDGQTVLTGSEKADTSGEAQLWDVPPPAANDPERLRLSVEIRTGSELDENSGTIKPLSQAEWLMRRERLKKFSGPCDVRTWDQVSDVEKKQLRTCRKSQNNQ